MSKGSGRRPTNEAAFGSGWDRVFGSKVDASSSNGKTLGSTPKDLCSNQSEAANSALVYVDDASGRIVDEDYWPNG